MSKQKKPSHPSNFYIFMIVLGLLGLATSWGIIGPRYVLLIPGLSATAIGKVTNYQREWSMDGDYEYLVAVVQFSDSSQRLHTIKWRASIQGDVNVRYSPLKPDFAIVEGSWLDITDVILQLPCIDLPCLALAILGAFLYLNKTQMRKGTIEIDHASGH